MSAEDDLKAFITGIDGFQDKGHADMVRMFAWLQHFLRKKTRFGTGDINWCYNTLSLKSPNTSQYLIQMEGRGELLKDKNGYHCEGKFLAKYDGLYGTHDVTLKIRQMVKDLINKIPNVAEKDFMKEAEICLRHDAGRATIIMVWNVAFYHLCQYILKYKLAEFNTGYQTHYNKKWQDAKVKTIKTYDDFAVDLKESVIVDICRREQIITEGVAKILVEKLNKRNSAAHPSTIHVGQVQAEAYIDELVTNVILVLPI
ncbi:MAG: hypothetical protein WBM04_19925 [Candidatus Korobacteraceae bacterium]